MSIWRTVALFVPKFNPNIRLKVIGQTRWGKKRSMLKNIISTDLHLFVLIRTFFEICNMDGLDGDALVKASHILTTWIQYDNCVYTYLMHEVFTHLDIVSKQLQKYGLNILCAMNAIKNCLENLNKVQENMQTFADKADNLIIKVNSLIEREEYFVSNEGNINCQIQIPRCDEEKKRIQMETINAVNEYIDNLKTSLEKYFIKQFNDQD